ncbi:MAG TPA: hypothetical protein VJN67_12930 [Stellaceae bacterium]|nr:hypothetical protein [Stellaceae bacterium]
MKRILVRYKAKPDKVAENTALIERVFEELRMTAPDDVRYLVLRLDDGSFLHFAEQADDAPGLQALEAFRIFQSGHGERRLEPPLRESPTIVGSYRMLAE